MSLTAGLELLYRQFSVYPQPDVTVCDQCGPQWSDDDLRATPLRALTLDQLTAIHIMALDDDTLRYYLPRLMELMLDTQSPVFDLRLSELRARITAWQSAERSALRRFAELVWSQLVVTYPTALGYFSDCPSALDLLDWCGSPLRPHLDALLSGESPSAARHLADLVEALFTQRDPFETVPTAQVLDWIKDQTVGDRLEAAFFSATSADAAQQLSRAHELWTVCARNAGAH